MENALVVYNGFLNTASLPPCVRLFCDAAKKFGVNLAPVKNTEFADLLTTGGANSIARLSPYKYKFIIFWDKDLVLCDTLEKNGYAVHNGRRAIEVCDDKALTALALDGRVKMPKTAVAPKTFTNIGYTNADFLDFVENFLEFPIVVKERFGSLGEQVFFAGDKKTLKNIVANIGGRPVLFQEFINTSETPKIISRSTQNHALKRVFEAINEKTDENCDDAPGKGAFDIRLYVIGGKAEGAVLRHNPADFRANFAQGSHSFFYVPSPEEKILAETAANLLGLSFCGVDIAMDARGERYLLEVNSNAGFVDFNKTSGINIAEKILSFLTAQK
ncbi:MAG: ATP-grasp domain-containing protein [Clostridiales bacterium]|jgi:glutathione synthase/RimK-type ligase-like ATP-grasp enzyme|nr:ATP-grasp domain-containing protein [Clostridiales bacterium]